VSQERTEGVVMRGVDFSETSRIVTFLCPARGRLTCIAKGVRRRKSALAPVLDTLNRVELGYYWKENRAVQTLSDATLLDGFSGIKSNLEKAVHAAFPLEVAYKTARDNEPSHELYAALVRGLEGFARFEGDVKAYTCWHVLRLLTAAGFAPAIDMCAKCGAPVGQRPGFVYDGGTTCGACRGDVRLSPRDYDVLRALLENSQSCPEATDVSAVFAVLHRYASRQLDTQFRSLRVIEEMVG